MTPRLSSWPAAAGILLMACLLVVEMFTHVLITVGYVAIAGCALWLSGRNIHLHLIAASATILLVVGYIFAITLEHPLDQDTFLLNRASAVAVIWFAYYFTLRYRSTQERAREQRIELDEQKLAAEALRSSLDLHEAIASNFPVGWIGILDEQLKYVVAGGRGLSRAGINPGEILGKPFTLVHKSDDAEQHLKKALTGSNVSFELAFAGRKFEIHASRLKGVSRTTWILAVVHDITTVKETEKRLLETIARERELGEMKTRFVTMASHEFRTPLTTIMSSASLLSGYNGEKYEKQKVNHIGRIKQSVKLLTDILDDFLSYGRIEEGEMSPNYKHIDIARFLEEVAKESESLRQTGQQLSVKHFGDTSMVSDPYFLKAILYNLTSNAFKYSRPGDRVVLEADAGNGRVKLRVTDHGIGIAPTDLPHVFDRFFRGENAMNIQGTGLGLCIARKYALLLGGDISCTSHVNDGTTFTVDVPATAES